MGVRPSCQIGKEGSAGEGTWFKRVVLCNSDGFFILPSLIMSPRSKSTRSKKAPEPVPPVSLPTAASSTIRPRPRPTRRSAQEINKDALLEEFNSCYDKAEAFKEGLLASDAKTFVTNGKAFTASIVRRVSSFLAPLLMFIRSGGPSRCSKEDGGYSARRMGARAG
jgi:hypothetical protein